MISDTEGQYLKINQTKQTSKSERENAFSSKTWNIHRQGKQRQTKLPSYEHQQIRNWRTAIYLQEANRTVTRQ
jgi:hypothetical protein